MSLRPIQLLSIQFQQVQKSFYHHRYIQYLRSIPKIFMSLPYSICDDEYYDQQNLSKSMLIPILLVSSKRIINLLLYLDPNYQNIQFIL